MIFSQKNLYRTKIYAGRNACIRLKGPDIEVFVCPIVYTFILVARPILKSKFSLHHKIFILKLHKRNEKRFGYRKSGFKIIHQATVTIHSKTAGMSNRTVAGLSKASVLTPQRSWGFCMSLWEYLRKKLKSFFPQQHINIYQWEAIGA